VYHTLGSLLTSPQIGDVILTGTPSGVGPVKPGDKVDCRLKDNATGAELAKIEFEAVGGIGKYEFKGWGMQKMYLQTS